MQFKFQYHSDIKLYMIDLYNDNSHIVYPGYVRKLLNITAKDYIDIFQQLGAVKHTLKVGFDEEFTFFGWENEKDAQKAVDYLNEKYIVLIKMLIDQPGDPYEIYI